MDGDGSIGCDDVQDALPPLVHDCVGEGNHAGVDKGIDFVSELDRDRGVAERHKTERFF